MACLVCDHSKRFAIETALREGTPKLKVAKIFNIRRQTLQDHIRFKHEEKSPAKPPDPSVAVDEEVHALPTDAQIKRMHSRRERLAYVERLIEDRKFFGSETMARLIRLWRESAVTQDTAIHVAELFAEALKRQTFARGPKAIRRQFAMAEYLSMSRACRESGDNKTALAAFDKYVELDNLKEDPVAIHKQILAQYIQIVQVGAPHLLPHIQAVTAQIEEGCDRAIAVLEGEIPPQMPLLSHAEEPVQEAPPTPRSNEAQSESGIDTGLSPSDSTRDVPSSE
jgi:hypothetical protein